MVRDPGAANQKSGSLGYQLRVGVPWQLAHAGLIGSRVFQIAVRTNKHLMPRTARR
jgi:hypothetical protein